MEEELPGETFTSRSVSYITFLRHHDSKEGDKKGNLFIMLILFFCSSLCRASRFEEC